MACLHVWILWVAHGNDGRSATALVTWSVLFLQIVARRERRTAISTRNRTRMRETKQAKTSILYRSIVPVSLVRRLQSYPAMDGARHTTAMIPMAWVVR